MTIQFSTGLIIDTESILAINPTEDGYSEIICDNGIRIPIKLTSNRIYKKFNVKQKHNQLGNLGNTFLQFKESFSVIE